jgi:hypothetical protein
MRNKTFLSNLEGGVTPPNAVIRAVAFDSRPPNVRRLSLLTLPAGSATPPYRRLRDFAPLVPLPDASRAADMLFDCWIAGVSHLARSGNRYLQYLARRHLRFSGAGDR